jgi:hypothetical protein
MALILTISAVIVLLWTMGQDVQSMSVQRLADTSIHRLPRPMPVVENFYAQGWDFRARNNEEQIFVLTHALETLETKLFRIGAAINLSSHLGYAPPTIIVEAGRLTDSPIPSTYRDMPELLQDIFPRLRVVSVQNPKLFLSSLPSVTLVDGNMKMSSRDGLCFREFPAIDTTTIVFDGDWESWKYLDDYRKAMFEHLEFHPIIYHHCRKTYPQLFDRKITTKGIFIQDISQICAEQIQTFVRRTEAPNEKILMFIPEPIGTKVLQTLFGPDYETHVSVVVGECTHVQIYLGVFCRELLIDVSSLGWWVGFHAHFRGKPVYYHQEDKISLIDHAIHPGWLKNKN